MSNLRLGCTTDEALLTPKQQLSTGIAGSLLRAACLCSAKTLLNLVDPNLDGFGFWLLARAHCRLTVDPSLILIPHRALAIQFLDTKSRIQDTH